MAKITILSYRTVELEGRNVNLCLSETRSWESNFSRVYGFIDMFVKNIPYTDRLRFLDELEKITKEEIVEFAIHHRYGQKPSQ